MPTDLTTAEKAERLGLTKCRCGCALWLTEPGGSGGYGTAGVHDLYAERFPVPPYTDEPAPSLGEDRLSPIEDPTAPDYRAALEGLEREAIALLDILDRSEDATEAIHGDAYHPNLQDDVYNAKSAVRTALTHARKVLHVQ